MPPNRTDLRSEALASSKTTSTLSAAEKRRIQAAASHANGPHAHEGIEGMGWDDIPLPVLHRYRYAYRLPMPSASNGYSSIVLSTGIGKKTPSRAGGRARVNRETLATAVRKNFNAQPIQENEVIVNFLYSVKNQDKHFRLQFPPVVGGKKGAASPLETTSITATAPTTNTTNGSSGINGVVNT